MFETTYFQMFEDCTVLGLIPSINCNLTTLLLLPLCYFQDFHTVSESKCDSEQIKVFWIKI